MGSFPDDIGLAESARKESSAHRRVSSVAGLPITLPAMACERIPPNLVLGRGALP